MKPAPQPNPSPAVPSRQEQSAYYSLAAWLVLAICLTVTWMVWRNAENEVREKSQAVFAEWTFDIDSELKHQLDIYQNTLHGAASLFVAAGPVTRASWINYVRGLHLEKLPRTIWAVGFGEHVTAASKAAHEKRVRSEGLPEYAISPAGERSEYVPATYIEYLVDTEGGRAEGFDMLSEPRRRMAIERARDTGTTAITDRIIPAVTPASELAHTDAFHLIYHPVYRTAAVPPTATARREAIRGYVYLRTNLDQLLMVILRGRYSSIRVEVFDGPDATESARIFDSHPAHAGNSGNGMARTAPLEFAGKTWTLRYRAQEQFDATIGHDKPHVVAVAGIIISLLLAAITWSLANTRTRAMALANRMTAALHDSEAFAHSVVDTAVDAIIVIDERGVMQSFNRAAERIFGYTEAEAIGKNVNMLMPQPYREMHDTYLANYLTTGEKKIIGIGREVAGLRKSGETLPMELAVSEIAASGRRAFTGIVRDITERKRAEQQILGLNRDLQRHAEQLAAANRELEAFSYSISHDLRAPLRHVIAYIDLIKTKAVAVDTQTKRYLDIIAASATKLRTLIDDLLDFSRMARTELQQTGVDLGALANDVILELQPDCNDRDIVWRVGKIPAVRGDAAMLNVALVNLISNALKFTRGRAQAVIEIGQAAGDPGQVVVFVRDNGAGFDMRYVNKLFNVFQRLHDADEFEGTGIGLAIVQRIINRHGGRTWAESRLDAGATFYLTLPSHPQQSEDSRS